MSVSPSIITPVTCTGLLLRFFSGHTGTESTGKAHNYALHPTSPNCPQRCYWFTKEGFVSSGSVSLVRQVALYLVCLVDQCLVCVVDQCLVCIVCLVDQCLACLVD